MSRLVEIESLADFDAHIAEAKHGGAISMSGWVIQSIDLTDRDGVLLAADPREATFLGCELADLTADVLEARGAIIFPKIDGLPFNPYRAQLYTASELYDAVRDGRDYSETLDARIYTWAGTHPADLGLRGSLSTALHDHSIHDALTDLAALLPTDKTIGIMGGHAITRDHPDFARAARLAAGLTAHGNVVMTGGGPGAMEAANLGSYLAGEPDAIAPAVGILATAPRFADGITAWARAALRVIDAWSPSGMSIGVPTWFYGHEPPNLFGTAIAKYFSNALREDMLLRQCGGGIVFLPGAAGTVQEIFQTATGNYYATDDAEVCPMVLVDVDHWERRLPAWQLLTALGRDRAMGDRLHLVDTIDEALDLLLG